MTPDGNRTKEWFVSAVSLSRQDVVQGLRRKGVPEGWTKSPLLRNCYPLVLDSTGRWTEDATVRLDDDLGLVYEPKEQQ
jgi:CRISPR-associated endonuclease/helicase Cas3